MTDTRLCTHHLNESLKQTHEAGNISSPPFHPEEAGLGKLSHCPRWQSLGASNQDVHPGNLTPHHAVCHYQILLICSIAVLQLLVRLYMLSMCLLAIYISYSIVSFMWHLWCLFGTCKPSWTSIQASLKAYISHGGNSRSLGWNTPKVSSIPCPKSEHVTGISYPWGKTELPSNKV